jgi:hypothetical protein
MPVKQMDTDQVAECDKCMTRWVIGSPRQVDFRFRKVGDMVEVVCAKCSPEPLQ